MRFSNVESLDTALAWVIDRDPDQGVAVAEATAPQVRDLILVPTADEVALDLARGTARLAGERLSGLAVPLRPGYDLGLGFAILDFFDLGGGLGVTSGDTAPVRVVDRDPEQVV